MTVDLYSTGCPKCNVLAIKLLSSNIPHNKITDNDIVLKKAEEFGLAEAPFLVIDNNKVLKFADALQWIKEYKGE